MSSTPPSSPAPPHSPQGPDAPPVEEAAGSSKSQVKSLSVPGLLAGGAAAATTSVIGGQLGISGTVLGAAITSVLSAAVVAFYTDSVNGTARKLKQVTAKAGGRRSPAAGAGRFTPRALAAVRARTTPSGRSPPGRPRTGPVRTAPPRRRRVVADGSRRSP